MNLSDVITAYLADRRAKGIAPATISSEKQVLSLLLADIGNISTRQLRPQHMDVFWAKRTNWSSGTMNRARYNLSSFFAWCRVRGHLARDADPLAGTRVLRVPPRDWVTIPQSEFATLLDSIKRPRRRIIVALGLYLFLRISEIQAMRWQDINLEASEATVFRRKTQTLDVLPICEELADELKRWHLAYGAKMGQPPLPAWYVIPAMEQGGFRSSVPGVKGFSVVRDRGWLPTKESRLNYVIKEELIAAGYYQTREGGHTLRRSGAIALYNQLSSVGHDRAIRLCQAMLGHASVSTTEVYLRLDLDRKLRNDLLAGKPMFPSTEEAQVVRLGEGANGQANVGSV